MVILHPVLLVLCMEGSRFAYCAWKERKLYGELCGKGDPVDVIGSGEDAVTLVRDLVRSTE